MGDKKNNHNRKQNNNTRSGIQKIVVFAACLAVIAEREIRKPVVVDPSEVLPG